MRPEPRPEVADLAAALHGGSQDPELLDFSTGVSPLPAPSEIVTAAREADLSRYPDPTALPVREAIARIHAVSPDRVVVGAGSVELIWALARAFAGPCRRGLVVTPAFGEYAQALKASGAAVVSVHMTAPRFAFPLEMVEAGLAESPVATVFICRPSNPCLTAAPADDIRTLAQRWPETLFVIDEAYLLLFEGVEGTPLEPNIALLRSLTKVFALPGLRIGYLVATTEVAAAVQAALPPWNVSSPAQAAGVAASALLASHIGPVRSRIAALRSSLAEGLSALIGSAEQAGGPFLLYMTDTAAALAHDLRQRGVLVRHAASFGLPQHIRIGVRSDADHRALVRAWSDIAGPSSTAQSQTRK